MATGCWRKFSRVLAVTSIALLLSNASAAMRTARPAPAAPRVAPPAELATTGSDSTATSAVLDAPLARQAERALRANPGTSSAARAAEHAAPDVCGVRVPAHAPNAWQATRLATKRALRLSARPIRLMKFLRLQSRRSAALEGSAA